MSLMITYSKPCCGTAAVRRVKRLSTAVQFYQNKQLEAYASKSANPLTLRQLVFFGRAMDEGRLIKSANYVRTELPIRIAHRLRDLQSLPYVVVTQENMAKVYELYWSAFERVKRFPVIHSLKDNERFCELCKTLLKEHIAVIPNLTLGMSLSSPYLASTYLDSFMKRMLTSRISRRVLVEHHVALTEGLRTASGSRDPTKRNVGIISTDLDAQATLEKCVALIQQHPQWAMNDPGEQYTSDSLPECAVDGQKNIRFAYIREHLEYIFLELLKNAICATTLKHRGSRRFGRPPAVRATIVSSASDISMRISDQGGGILIPSVCCSADLFSFSHTRNSSRMQGERLGALRFATSRRQGLSGTVNDQLEFDLEQEAEAEASHPRLGIGLPMSNIYSTYFGGALDVVSLDGWGTDVYLRLPKLACPLSVLLPRADLEQGTNLEGIEV